MNTCLLSLLLVVGFAATVTPASSKIRGTALDSPFLCLILKAHETGALGHLEHFSCDLIPEKNGTIAYGLIIDLPEDVVDENLEALHRGEWFVKMEGATVEETYIEGHGMIPTSITIPRGTIITTVSPYEGEMAMLSLKGMNPLTSDASGERQRRQLLTTGPHMVLVLRVSVSDSSPTITASELANTFFGSSSSVVSQYNGCSFGAIQFQPYDPTFPVVDVVITGRGASFNKDTLWPLAIAAAASELNVYSLSDIAQHVAIVIPPGLSDSNSAWYAIGNVGSWRSFYNNAFAGFPTFPVHELGHNIGMGHAGVGDDPYADESSVMGYGDTQKLGITKCFNGYHFWYLKWFEGRSISVDPYTHNVLTLVAFAHHDRTIANQYVVIKVDNYHLVYNRAIGVNEGVNDVRDKVTVAQAKPGVFSVRVAALDGVSRTFGIANYGGGTDSLIIKVCSIVNGGNVDYAVVSIGVGVSDCNDNIQGTRDTTTPTASPVRDPTASPTAFPTTSPSPAPTTAPTRAIAAEPVAPTVAPVAPTLDPAITSIRPTLRKRRRPTQAPVLLTT